MKRDQIVRRCPMVGAFKQTTRKSHRISGERARSRGLQAMLFEPVVQIGFGGVIAPRDELLRRTVRQQALDLRPKGIQLALARSPGPAELQSLGFLEAQSLFRAL